MSSTTEKIPQLLVLAPEILARSFFDPECRHVLEAWRDGTFRTAVSPPLLRYYALVLQGLGIPEKQIRRWLVWFTAPDKSLVLSTLDTASQSLPLLLLETARQSDAEKIVAVSIPVSEDINEKNISWLTANEYMQQKIQQR